MENGADPNDAREDSSRLPPHERRAMAHRERYHGRATALPPWSVKARLKQMDRDGYRFCALCGFPLPNGQSCSGSLGEASRPNGVEPDWAGYGRGLLEFETYGPRQSDGYLGDWTLTAPREFPGFERVSDGSFDVIRGRRERALDGSRVRTRTGRRETPDVLYSAGMPLTEQDRPGGLDSKGREHAEIRGTAGWRAELPGVVACPLCGRKNLVEEPKLA